MFLKFIAYNNFSGPQRYYNYNKITIYDCNNEVIKNLNHSNVINHTFKERCTDSDLDLFFTDNEYVPYCSTLQDSSEMIISIPYDSISKIEIMSYGNGGGATMVDIFYSNNKDNFDKKYGTIKFDRIYQTVGIGLIIKPNRYLFEQNNEYYTIKSQFYNHSTDKYLPSEKDYDKKGFVLSDLICNIESIELIGKKNTINNIDLFEIDLNNNIKELEVIK